MNKAALSTVIVIGFAAVAVGVLSFAPDLTLSLRTQVVPVVPPTDDTYELSWTPDSSTPPGDYPVTVRFTDENGIVTEQEIIITVIAPDPIAEVPSVATGGDDGHAHGGGGGGGGGSTTTPKSAAAPKAYTFEVESGSRITGNTNYSGVDPADKTKVVLAQPKATLERAVSVPAGEYDLQIRAKADQPGPVLMAIYLGNRAWKVVSLKESDNKYRTYQIGRLRNFSKAKIRFRLIKDQFTCTPAQIQAKQIDGCDRNLYLDKFILKPAQD